MPVRPYSPYTSIRKSSDRVALFGFAILVLVPLYYLFQYFTYYFRDFSTAELRLPFFGMYSALNFISSLATGLLFALFLYFLFLGLTRDISNVNQSLSQKGQLVLYGISLLSACLFLILFYMSTVRFLVSYKYCYDTGGTYAVDQTTGFQTYAPPPVPARINKRTRNNMRLGVHEEFWVKKADLCPAFETYSSKNAPKNALVVFD